VLNRVRRHLRCWTVSTRDISLPWQTVPHQVVATQRGRPNSRCEDAVGLSLANFGRKGPPGAHASLSSARTDSHALGRRVPADDHGQLAASVERHLNAALPVNLSAPAMQVLTIVAYPQPVSQVPRACAAPAAPVPSARCSFQPYVGMTPLVQGRRLPRCRLRHQGPTSFRRRIRQ
jgi:hypothetical protein